MKIYASAADQGLDWHLRRIKKMPFALVIGDGRYHVAPAHQSDVISVMVTILEQAPSKNAICIVAGPEDLTCHELTGKIFMRCEAGKIKIHIPAAFASPLLKIYAVLRGSRDSFVADQVPRLLSQQDHNLWAARRDLDFHPRSLESFLFEKILRDETNGK
ncbi:MAG TPA: hypothetical protein P5040_01425 [Smithella sp.]|nr:hypothetical protein [Smithella sp.]HRS96814.1 hypothetical protein [Smithella sp.]